MTFDLQMQCFLVSLGLLLVSAFALFGRIRRGDLFTASGGLHMNILLFFGVGGLTYAFSEKGIGRFELYDQIVEAMTHVGLALLVAYVLSIALEIWINSSKRNKSGFEIPIVDRYSMILLAVFWVLSIGGRVFSDWDFAKSGIGTVFPVLRMFQYPITALAISMTSRREPYTFVILATVLAVSACQALISPWRSDIIFLSGAISLGLILKGRRLLIRSQLLLIALLLLLLPFANLKKLHYDEVIADPLSAFDETLQTSFQERLDLLIDFWSVRINGLREAAFVSKGLAEGNISYRNGETYWEAVKQLVPRAVWPEKPSFNQTSGFELPRQIGLLSRKDQTTSWGVNFYAEAIWNVGERGLFLFVPLLFFLVGKLDQAIQRRVSHGAFRWLIQGALFFMFIDCVGLVNMGTYLLWSIIIAVAIENTLRVLPLRGSSPVRLVTPWGIRG